MQRAPVTALRKALCALALAASMVALPWVAHARPASTSATRPASALDTLSAARSRAVALQERIEDDRETLAALDERISAMNQRLFQQRTRWSDARAELRAAQSRYRSRMVTVYRSGGMSSIELIVESGSLRDLFRRSTLMARLAEADRDSLVDARQAEAEAAYHAGVLSEMKTYMQQLHADRQKRLNELEKSLSSQRALVSRLEPTAQKQVQAAVRGTSTRRATVRKEWKRSSVPIGSSVWLAKATVSPYKHEYLVTSHQPRKYRSAGSRYTAVCSWYGNEFHGRRTASGQIFNENDFTCASRTLPFGTRLALSRNSLRIVVVVTDRGPFIHGRDLDLSKAAARALGFSGVASVTAERVVVR